MMTQAQVVRTQIERMERPVPPPLPVTPPQPPSPRGGSMYSNRYSFLSILNCFLILIFLLLIFNLLFLTYFSNILLKYTTRFCLVSNDIIKKRKVNSILSNANWNIPQSIRSTATQIASSSGRAEDSRFIPNIPGFGGVRPLFQDPTRHVQPEQRHIRVPAASEGEPRVQKRLRQITIVRSKVERLLWEGQYLSLIHI